MHLLLGGFRDLAARRLADRLDGAAALADDDLLLPVARDIDRLLDARRAVLLIFPGFGLDRRLIGQFVVQPLEDFFARDLGGEHAQRRVGELIFRIEPGRGLHQRAELGQQIGDAVAIERGDHEGLDEIGLRRQRRASAPAAIRAAPDRSC